MPENLGRSATSEVEALVALVKDAKRLDREAAQATGRRNAAFQELRNQLGWGDLLAVIRNAENRIGELMTQEHSIFEMED